MKRSPPAAARPSAAALAALALALPSPGAADSGGLSARLALADAAGGAIAAPTAGQDVGLEVALTSAADGSAPRGVRLEGWLRPVSGTDLPCLDAAQSFRATRFIPTGGIDLNGILLVAFNKDGSFGITDPRLNLASANMVAAGATGQAAPQLIAADPVGQRVWLRDPASGAVQAVSADGRIVTLDTPDLGASVALVSDGQGGVWAAGTRGLWRLGEDDVPRAPSGMDGPVLGLRPAGPQAIAAWTGQRLLLADRRSGAPIAKAVPAGGIRAADAATLTDPRGGKATLAAVLSADGRQARLIWADAPDAEQALALPAEATRVDIQPEGGRILFWDPAGALSVVDPVSGRLAGAVAVHAGISAVAFAGRAAFLMAPDASAVTVLDLGSVGPGKAPALQQVRLDRRAARPVDPRGTEGLLVSLAPAPRAIAVHPESRTMFVIEARDSLGEAPPMTTGQLRGGRPERIAVLDRSFRETAPGRFATRAVIPTPGEWELVLTTGIGGLSTCFRLDVAPHPDAPAPAAARRPPARLVVLPGAAPVLGGRSMIRLALQDDKGNALPLGAPGRLSVTSLDYGWQAPARVTAASAQALEAEVELRLPGLYAIALEGPGPVIPATLEVPP